MTNSVLATGTVLGCNRPKPGSASKPGATTNGESSFDRFSLRPTLLAANWDLTFPNYSAQKISSPRAKLVNVGMQVGNLIIQFGWRIDMEQYNVIAADARTALRIEDVEADDLPTTC
ncbi:hypothetical protein MiSe_94530 [Microseira wollei NIES-4236]|uniref:Uncharacterized protein n=2 Tax=Microseira wollei TaxID=467598 RepID=A0AAV3XUQ6_9CYAN|nr:hypothetical protein MiSe_94530 [Microseira wollei NIES-4236]